MLTGILARKYMLRNHLLNLFKFNTGNLPEVVLSMQHCKDRHRYLMAQLFIRAGYFVYILDKFGVSDYYNSDLYANYVFDDKNVSFKSKITKKMENMILCYDDQSLDSVSSLFRKSIRMNYDVPEGIESHGSIIPYLMHPNAYRANTVTSIKSLRNNRRNVKLFFGGNIADGVYDRDSFMLPGNLTRRGIVKALTDYLSNSRRITVVSDSKELKQIMGENHDNQLIIFDATTARVGRSEWLPIVSSCDFFLCLPGVLMPMSHNIVEAMSVGAVPIFNYPEWLSPMPTHGENCLTYRTIDELIQLVEFAFRVEDKEIEKLRVGALAYYDKYMDPSSFLRSLENDQSNRVTLYCCAEFITRDFASKRFVKI